MLATCGLFLINPNYVFAWSLGDITKPLEKAAKGVGNAVSGTVAATVDVVKGDSPKEHLKKAEGGVRGVRDGALGTVNGVGSGAEELICGAAEVIDDDAKCNVNMEANATTNGDTSTVAAGDTTIDEAQYYKNKYFNTNTTISDQNGKKIKLILLEWPGLTIQAKEEADESGIKFTAKTERTWYTENEEISLSFSLPDPNTFYQRVNDKSLPPVLLTPGLDMGTNMTYKGWYTSYNSQIVLTNIGYKYQQSSPKPNEYDSVRVTGLSYKEGGVYPGSHSHRTGHDIDISSDLINQNLNTYNRDAAVRLMAIVLKEELVTHVIYHDKTIYEDAKKLVGKTHVILIDRDAQGDHRNHMHIRVKTR